MKGERRSFERPNAEPDYRQLPEFSTFSPAQSKDLPNDDRICGLIYFAPQKLLTSHVKKEKVRIE
jgi:hypothetical protein